MSAFSMSVKSLFAGNAGDLPISTAVILVDMQEGFIRNLRYGECDRIIPNQLEILRHCCSVNIPVVVLEFFGFGPTIRTLKKEVKKNPNHRYIKKDYDSGFYRTALHAHLQSLGVKHIFLMGINADYCVKDTAEDAIKKGYKIITCNEVISGQYHHSHDNSVPWFRANGRYVNAIVTLLKQ